MTIMIDNRDSFTFNLVDAFTRVGARMRVLRNDIAPDDAIGHAVADGEGIIISPGPGTPEDAGCCIDLVQRAAGVVPVIGICLGHQAIVAARGGRVERAASPSHGKASALTHNGGGPFAGLPQPLTIGRYHSLCTNVGALPSGLTVDATLEGMAMAIRDEGAGQIGLQFHPESILTPNGDALIDNLYRWLRDWRPAGVKPALAVEAAR